MTAIDATSLDSVAAYKLISGSVTPRPIAWTSTLNDDLSVNLAPFSSYIFLTYMPPKVGISIGPGTERLKDTLRNINRVGEFVVNSVSASQLQIMAETSRAYPPGLSEAADQRVVLAPSLRIAPPRVAESAVAMECVVDRVVPLEDADAHRLVVGRVVVFHVRDDLLQGDRIDPYAYRPVGRVGGRLYVIPGEIRRIDPTPDERMV